MVVLYKEFLLHTLQYIPSKTKEKNDFSGLVYASCVVYGYMDADVYEILE